MTKLPSPQAISALLRKAGFTKSVSSSSRIKGWREYSEGFIARTYRQRAVEVDHSTGFSRGPGAEQRAAEMLAKYADVLTLHGYVVEPDALHGLIVTRPAGSGEGAAEEDPCGP